MAVIRSLMYLLLFLIATTQVAAQTDFIAMKGSIVDEENLPLPYINVSLRKDQSIGTYSNSFGDFEIKIPGTYSQDSIAFSCIGYETSVISIAGINTPLNIVLKAKVYTLNEVVISSDSAVFILKKGIAQLGNNLYCGNSIIQGFYREMILSDYACDRLIEAAVDVFDMGYCKSKDLQFRVREIRKSNDYRDLSWEQSIYNYISPRNGLCEHFESVFFNDYIRNNESYYNPMLAAPINAKEFLINNLLSIDSVVEVDNNKVWCINIHSKIETGDFSEQGTIYIRQKDYAILQMEHQTLTNPESTGRLSFPGEKYLHKTLIKYKEYNGKMYISLLHRKAYRLTVNSEKLRKAKAAGKRGGQFFYDLLFVTNEIITEKDKAEAFKKKDRVLKKMDLYTKEWKYNEAFWDTYNIVKENPLEPVNKKGIERDLPLDEQFKKNGSNR
ncbi:MAG TPA: carboxypeptidase-like regulatory domain-containing protein [Ohtaekwangia sp.]|uniref:carboxypeptidase-like regulatory domain-containing protein n=1 Tax=Ohtaekwangia sp. TaxID=2066019 RepID=UPI002F920935